MRAISRLASLAARVEYNRTLPSLLACKTRPCLALHPPTGNRQFRAQLLRAGKSDKTTFSKIKFLSLECRGNTRFLKNYGISVKSFDFFSHIRLQNNIYCIILWTERFSGQPARRIAAEYIPAQYSNCSLQTAQKKSRHKHVFKKL